MLQNAQYDTIMREYNRRQLHNRQRQQEHIEEIYQKLPAIRKIDQSVAALTLEKTKALLAGASNGTADLKESIRTLSAKRRRLLMEEGYPEDYLDMQYTCPRCQDTGYVGNEKCLCFKKAALELLYAQSNLGEILEKENFAHFSFRYYSATIKNEATGLNAYQTALLAVEKAKNFIGQFGSSFQNLFLYGDTGVGKTFLSHCIAKELLDQAYWVVYFTAFDLFDLFARRTFDRDEEAAPWMDSVFSCDLLIIDDLGTELTNSFVSSQLFLCVNERLMRQKSTLISTNLGIRQFSDTYSERTFSRIASNYEMIKLIGQDIRKQKTLSGGYDYGTGQQ